MLPCIDWTQRWQESEMVSPNAKTQRAHQSVTLRRVWRIPPAQSRSLSLLSADHGLRCSERRLSSRLKPLPQGSRLFRRLLCREKLLLRCVALACL